MAREIERRFLVDRGLPGLDGAGHARLRQAYVVVAADRSARIRIRDDADATLTLKFGTGGLVRDEFEYAIPVADAMELAKLRIGSWIEKTRYVLPTGDHAVELDVYSGALAGLVVAEIEMSSETDVPVLPDWLRREITGDSAYSNLSLALHGLPEPGQ